MPLDIITSRWAGPLPFPAGDASTPIEPWIVEEDEEAAEVKTVRAAMACKYRNQGELANALGIDQSTVSHHINNFVKKKLKIRDNTGHWITFKKEEIEDFFSGNDHEEQRIALMQKLQSTNLCG